MMPVKETQMERWGWFVARRSWSVLVAGLLVLVAAGAYGFGVFGSLSNGGFDDPKTDSVKEINVEQARFGKHSADVVAVYSNKTASVGDPAFERSVRKVVASLPRSSVERVVTWYDSHATALVSKDQHATVVIITLRGTTQDTAADSYNAVKNLLDADGLTTHVGGQWAVFGDVNKTVTKDIERAESISTPIVLVLSLFIFGSLVAALMPVLVGLVAVVGAFALVRVATLTADVSIFAINIITLIGMGFAIDYALFIVSRFREELERRPADDRENVREAVAATMATAGRTVLVSAVTVAASLASLLIFPQVFLRSMGFGGIAAVLVAMLAALTILPAVLMLLGSRINAVRLPWQRRAAERRTSDLVLGSGVWGRIARRVMARPAVSLVAIVVVLLALGSPFLGVRWGSVDERVLPTNAPSRVADDLIAREFGGAVSTARIVVAGASDQAVKAYKQQLGEVDGVTGVRAVDADTKSSPATLVEVSWNGSSQSQHSQSLVRELREVPVPSGATALVGGQSAQTVDLLSSVGRHLPWMALFVVVVMFVLLFVAFGSFVLPLKAVLMNAVSIAASFGVVTWIFADGHLDGLLGFESTGYLDATQPILMLAILFGLSMDYEVFLLSRVREHWDHTHDNTESVVAGVQHTGRIITSAALLLAVVIGAFATSGIVFIKMIGIGMLVALLLDATLVRLMLVPATMRLLGKVNWWAPSPLRRWYERYGLHETDGPNSPLRVPEPAGRV
jgi:uncharacterized membrane protein YdfJ with MMPL/SSD domain